MIITIIVATIASETRLSAKVVLANKLGVQNLSDTLTTLRMAEMELMISRMPDPPGKEQELPLSERRNKAYRFNGQVLGLAYPAPKNIQVRIYDHLGKINLQRLSPKQMRDLLENQVGNDLEQLDALMAAWQDWIDKDDLKRANGAEKEDYEELGLPYGPRNSPIETVEEFLLIKGFDKVFEGINMDAVFTIYSNMAGVNPNLASREVLLMIPGLDGKIVDTILTKRRDQDLKTFQDFNEFIEPEQMAKFQPWINFTPGSPFYTIALQTVEPKTDDQDKPAETDDTQVTKTTGAAEKAPTDTDEQTPDQAKKEQQAYMVMVQFLGINKPPKTLLVNPYGILPDTGEELMENEGTELENKKF